MVREVGESGLSSVDANGLKPFMIVWPPPNVTGTLLIGRALTAAIEDTMSGYNIVRVPGMDQARIATQVVVEKKLMRQKQLTRHDNGREESWPRFGNGRKARENDSTAAAPFGGFVDVSRWMGRDQTL